MTVVPLDHIQQVAVVQEQSSKALNAEVEWLYPLRRSVWILCVPRLHNPLPDSLLRVVIAECLKTCWMTYSWHLNGGIFAIVVITYDISHLAKLTEEELHRHRAAYGIVDVVTHDVVAGIEPLTFLEPHLSRCPRWTAPFDYGKSILTA